MYNAHVTFRLSWEYHPIWLWVVYAVEYEVFLVFDTTQLQWQTKPVSTLLAHQVSVWSKHMSTVTMITILLQLLHLLCVYFFLSFSLNMLFHVFANLIATSYTIMLYYTQICNVKPENTTLANEPWKCNLFILES